MLFNLINEKYPPIVDMDIPNVNYTYEIVSMGICLKKEVYNIKRKLSDDYMLDRRVSFYHLGIELSNMILDAMLATFMTSIVNGIGTWLSSYESDLNLSDVCIQTMMDESETGNVNEDTYLSIVDGIIYNFGTPDMREFIDMYNIETDELNAYIIEDFNMLIDELIGTMPPRPELKESIETFREAYAYAYITDIRISTNKEYEVRVKIINLS